MSLLSPMSNILPVAAAIISGLYLGMELLLKKPSVAATDRMNEQAGAAVDKAQDMLKKNADKIKMLEAQQVPIGLACIVLGILHIVIGNMMFF
jgi:hypothetical protein